MLFTFINPAKQRVHIEDLPDIDRALELAGLDGLPTDHGVISSGLAIIVYEYSLFVPVEKQHYFGINRRLYGGKALVYAFDERGETISLIHPIPPVTFMPSQRAVERNIALGLIVRPQI